MASQGNKRGLLFSLWVRRHRLFVVFATLGVLFACTSHAYAQEDGFVPFFPPDHEPGEYVPLRAEPYEDMQGSSEDSWYGIVYYDIYERAYRVEDFFPLGYSASVDYEYYPRLYETARGWEPVVLREIGTFMRGEEEIASYIKTFDESGNQTSNEREGFSIMIPIMKMLGGILGVDFNENDI